MRLGTLEIGVPVMNAACSVAKTIDDVRALSATKAGAVMVGSITVQARDGNAEPRWYVAEGYAINSFGMPNGGAQFYKENLPAMCDIAHAANKKFGVSIAGFNTKEFVTLAAIANDAQVDFIELNLGCPNISVGGSQKPIASFDTPRITEILNAVRAVTELTLTVKLSPFSNPAQLNEVAATIADNGHVAGVVVSNTYPNSLALKDGESVIAAGLGGLSGRAMQPIALGQVRQFRTVLPESIAVIGVGGIENTEDVARFMAAGADMVQAATLIVRDGHAALDGLVS